VLKDMTGVSSLVCPSCGRHLHPQKIDPFGEADWLACTDPELLLRFQPDWPNSRKCRLFACACLRVAWIDVTDARSRHAVEVAERLADGLADANEVKQARKEARAAAATLQGVPHVIVAASSVLDDRAPAIHAARIVIGQPWRKASSLIASLFRDIAGNPFRPPRPLSPAVLAWNDGTVPRIAAGIDAERAFDRLPILADALEDAGCNDEALVEHCRSPGPHVKGCWAVDWIRGKD
jgi:hypothetical protein